MIATLQRQYSLDEYRAIADTSEEKCEYHDGEIIKMAGGTINHSRIFGNIFVMLKLLLRDREFEVINSDLRLWIPEYRRGVYPDAMVFAKPVLLNGDRQDEVLNPLLIVEVLSASTEEFDRTDKFRDKFRMYRSIPSFSEYLLIRQNKVLVERFSKQEQGWLYSDFDGLDQAINLESLQIQLAIAEIYRSINF